MKKLSPSDLKALQVQELCTIIRNWRQYHVETVLLAYVLLRNRASDWENLLSFETKEIARYYSRSSLDTLLKEHLVHWGAETDKEVFQQIEEGTFRYSLQSDDTANYLKGWEDRISVILVLGWLGLFFYSVFLFQSRIQAELLMIIPMIALLLFLINIGRTIIRGQRKIYLETERQRS
ncbi:MAG: hypothetical protein AAFQ87_28090 [Bacteroidota bacterium]